MSILFPKEDSRSRTFGKGKSFGEHRGEERVLDLVVAGEDGNEEGYVDRDGEEVKGKCQMSAQQSRREEKDNEEVKDISSGRSRPYEAGVVEDNYVVRRLVWKVQLLDMTLDALTFTTSAGLTRMWNSSNRPKLQSWAPCFCKKAKNRTGQGNKGEISKLYRKLDELSVQILQFNMLLESSVTNGAIREALGSMVHDSQRSEKSGCASVLPKTIQQIKPSGEDPVSHRVSPGRDLQNLKTLHLRAPHNLKILYNKA